MDWSLRGCARKGHITYAPYEPALRERLHAHTPAGEAWRCLRCWDFVVGPPHSTGPAEDAPLVMRGKVLRDAFILRILAVERALRGLVVAALAYAVIRSLTQTLNDCHTFFVPAASGSDGQARAQGEIQGQGIGVGVQFDGRYVMRLAIGNARTTEADVRRAWEVLNG